MLPVVILAQAWVFFQRHCFKVDSLLRFPAMPVKKKVKKDGPSHARLTPFARGAIAALALVAGWSATDIAEVVVKSDGSVPTIRAIIQATQLAEAGGGLKWDGLVSGSTGRPRETSDALDKAILKMVFKYRGRAVVTTKFIQNSLKEARGVSARTVRRRLGEAGLKWLRRRRKTFVPIQHHASRLEWAAWVLRRTTSTLKRWAYTDGTVFYLARCQSEMQDKARAALGPMVYRMADGRDGLYHDCIGPSAYWKAQGTPVRIWGLLLAGILFIHILPEGVAMNAQVYASLIEAKFGGWLKKAFGRKAKHGAFLVQDHEKALWKAAPKKAMKEQSMTLLEDYPKYSQDFNAIETAWREVRVRLDATAPTGTDLEKRMAFIIRLRAAVAWVNKNRRAYLLYLCHNQKERVRDCQLATPPGSRTKH